MKSCRITRSRALFWLSAVVLAGYTYFTSSFTYESWGWTTGPRHLTGLVPFLLLPVGLVLEQLRAGRLRWLLGAAAGACTASIVITGAATFINYVPDNVSNAFLGLAVPLLKAGYLPPSVLSFFGIPQPDGGHPPAARAVGAGRLGLRAAGRGEGACPRRTSSSAGCSR